MDADTKSTMATCANGSGPWHDDSQAPDDGSEMEESKVKSRGSENNFYLYDYQYRLKFDYTNWMYWTQWWRQYWSWQALQYCVHTRRYMEMNQAPVPQITRPTHDPPAVRVRGYEAYIAPVWKRIFAELIDTVLFVFLLKVYFTDVDLRMPEPILSGDDVGVDEEELAVEVLVFLVSLLLQRTVHTVFETLWTGFFGCTPGKFVMGLRVLQCRSVHYTRTRPGTSIRVEPGRKISFFFALCRSVFKAVVSLFCPIIIFFIAMDRGRTKYDKLFNCAVVDVSKLFRAVPSAAHGGRMTLNNPLIR